MFLLYAALLLVPGALLAHRVLEERSRFVVAALSYPLGLVCLLIGSNLGLRLGLQLGTSLGGTFTALGVASLAMGRKRTGPKLEDDRLNPLTWLTLFVGLLLLVLYCNWSQYQNLDDDFWIHTPLQTEMLKGSYPPHNPFFPDLFLNGHFGRDLLIVDFTKLTGYTTFWTQMAFTTSVNVALYALMFGTLWRFTRSRAESLVGTAMMYWGTNMAHRVGCFDAFTNNQTVCHLWMFLMMFASLKLWEEQRLVPAVMGGVVLGSYAVVYETHFGLSVLAVVATAATLALLRDPERGLPISRRTLGLTLLMLVLSAPQAFTQGGVLTDLFRRKVLHVTPTATTKGLLNQEQQAEVHFPKKDLFCIREGWNEYQPISCTYFHWPTSLLLPMFNRADPAARYSYSFILSRQVLKMHWLPLFLSPLSLAVLLRARHRPGLYLWYLGMASYLTPALIDFGPIHECEYFRWEFGASMALAGALGVAAANLIGGWAGDPGVQFRFQPAPVEEGSPPQADWIEGRASLSVKGRLLLWLPLVLLLWANFIPAIWMVTTFLQGPWTVPESTVLKVNIRNWLKNQGARYGFNEADYDACVWLEPYVAAGHQRLLMNFPHQSPGGIAQESMILGLTGLFSVGHLLPPDDDPIGTPPFRMTQQTGQFFVNPTQQALAELHPDWILLRVPTDFFPRCQTNLELLPGVIKVYEKYGPFAEHRIIYRVAHS